MKNPFPVNLQTSAEVRQQGWQAESRDADGHLISCHAPIEADDQGIVEWIVECTSRGETVTFWPTKGDQPPPPSSHLRAIADAAQAYVESVNGEPQKDCWDTEDGKEATGAERFASDWAWQEYDAKKQKAFDALRASLTPNATPTEGSDNG